MAHNTTTLSFRLLDSAGVAVTSAAVKAIRQQDALLASTLAGADVIETTSNSSTGAVSLTLVCSDTVPVTYKVNLPDGQYFYLRVPPNASAIGLGVITTSSSPAKTVKNITDQLKFRVLGNAVASAAAIAPSGDVFHVTGTTNITSITSTYVPAGALISMIFDGILTLTDGNNLKLAGNYVTTADDVVNLVYDGTNWFDAGRGVN